MIAAAGPDSNGESGPAVFFFKAEEQCPRLTDVSENVSDFTEI